MIATQLIDIANWCQGALIAGVPSDTLDSISTDSRTLKKGNAFLALKGENFDGHEFVEKAIEEGAETLILSDLPRATVDFPGSIIHVRDTLKALQETALFYRRTAIPDLCAVGVTGSNGKTSTKDFLRSVFSRAGEVNATEGNLNNHIGLPLTVLKTDSGHRFGVWEMGMNHPGEIDPLAEIANPDAAVITNIGSAHIEHMKTREAIAEEKGALARAVPGDGYCVMPRSDEYFDFIADLADCEMVPVGEPDCEVKGENFEFSGDGISFDLKIGKDTARVDLPAPGRHMAMNALLAAAVGFRQGLNTDQIATALSETKLTGGRLQKIKWNGVVIWNDTYNANPDSVKAALSTLMEATSGEGRKIAALGFMGELGDLEESAHREIGEYAAELGLDLLVTVSDKAKLIAEGTHQKIPVRSFESHVEAAAYLKAELQPGDAVLAKGSRAAEMEKVIEQLRQD